MLQILAYILIRTVGLVLLLPVRLLFPFLFRQRLSSVVHLPPDDPGMRAAIERARSTVAEFIARLGAPSLDRRHTGVKAALPVAGGGHEHVWLANVRYENGAFVGTIDNDVVHKTGHRAGDEIRVPASEISDWKTVENGRLVGGYTIRYLRSRMTARQRAALDASVPFRIEDGESVPSAA